MSGKNITFGDKKIKKSDFYKNKKTNNIEDIDVKNTLVSKKESYGNKNLLKYFIGSNNHDIIRPICIKLLQMTEYGRKFNENSAMSFRVKGKQLLRNYNRIWETVENLMKIDFESKPVYGDDDKYIKTKIKIYAKNTITNFHNKKTPKGRVPCKCISILMIDSVIKANKKYYPQILLEECKYIQEKIKTENYINEDLEKSESDCDSNNEIESDLDNEE